MVKRNLDAMAAVKLNVFHWHLSDDQGFRVESKRFPKLQEMGSDGHFYTQDQVADVMEYARERGIRVVPEFDIPGHTQAWLAGYPELASTPGQYTIGRTWGIYYPVMDPTREETYQFLDGFIGEMAALFPDPYFHIGGDEVNPKEWKESARIMAVRQGAQPRRPAKACRRTSTSAFRRSWRRTGRSWWAGTRCCTRICPTTTVIQSWRGNEALANAAKQGHRGLLSWGYYLDHLRPASYHYAVDPLGGPAAQLPPERPRASSAARPACGPSTSDAGDGGFAHLAAAGRHRGAVLVAEGDRGRQFDVCADGGGEPPARVDRRAASCELRADARPLERLASRRAGPRARGCVGSAGAGAAGARDEVHEPRAAQSIRRYGPARE